MLKHQEDKERRVYEQLIEQEKEIQKLRNELQHYKKKHRHASPEIKSKMFVLKNNSKSQLITEKLSEPKVYKIIENLNENVTFKPEINKKSKRIIRDSDVWNILYQDAKDREVRHRERVNSEISNSRKRANSKNKSTERNNK